MVSWILFSDVIGSRWLFEDGREIVKTVSVGMKLQG